MASARFRELQNRLKKLRRHFLPKNPSPTGDYTERQLDQARGYRLLAHAEIEAFLEDKCKEMSISALKQFRLDGQPKVVLLNLMAFHLVQGQLSEKRLKEILDDKIQYCADAATQANSSYNHMLAKNNGIKGANLLQMVLPLGIDPNDIDLVWLNTLEAFGTDRGKVAHSSMIKAKQQIDPRSELKTVEDILEGLERLDGLIGALE